MEQPKLMPGAEPFGFEGGETGVLLVHGFTGSPQSMRPWGEALAAHGYTVLCPRLPGHGTTVADLASTTWHDWAGEADMALRGLSERCSSIFVGGLSMGGTITLDLAARNADRLRGVMLVNASVYTSDPRTKLAPLLGKLPLTLKGVSNDIADPSQHELAYDRISTKAVASFLAYQKVVRQRLLAVKNPALIFVSRQDHTVHPGNASFIAEHISSTDKEVVWLERSYHVATLDYDRDEIFARSAQFVAKHEQA